MSSSGVTFRQAAVVKPRYAFDVGQSVKDAEACNLVEINGNMNRRGHPG